MEIKISEEILAELEKKEAFLEYLRDNFIFSQIDQQAPFFYDYEQVREKFEKSKSLAEKRALLLDALWHHLYEKGHLEFSEPFVDDGTTIDILDKFGVTFTEKEGGA